jgi:hypothetical protein
VRAPRGRSVIWTIEEIRQAVEVVASWTEPGRKFEFDTEDRMLNPTRGVPLALLRAVMLLQTTPENWRPGRRKGTTAPRIDDTAARRFMIAVKEQTGESRGETLAGLAWEGRIAQGASKTAAAKRLSKWWRKQKAKN